MTISYFVIMLLMSSGEIETFDFVSSENTYYTAINECYDIVNTHIFDTENFPDQKVIAGMCKSKTNFYFK